MNEKLKKRQMERKAGCDFMNDRDKGDFADLECCTVLLVNAYKIHGEEGDYWSFIVAEEPSTFYFANAGLGQIFDDAQQIAEEDGQTIAEVLAGTRVHIGAMEKGKKGRSYRPVDIVD